MKKLLKSKITTQYQTLCSRGVAGKPKRCVCGNFLILNGKTRYGKQRFLCRTCKTTKVAEPKVITYGNHFNNQIIQLTNEGLGIRSTARVLGIAPSTVIRKILAIAESIEMSKILNGPGDVQVDELHTIVQNKKRAIYVIYPWSQELKEVLSLAVGTRPKNNLRKVVNPLLEADVKSINTDRYSGYKRIVPKKKHTTLILEAVLKIYFWADLNSTTYTN